QGKPIGQEIHAPDEQLTRCKGYDHNFCLNSADWCAEACDPTSGRVLRVQTSLPGVQLYCGNFLTAPFVRHQGFCLETQAWPDAPNQAWRAQCILAQGTEYAAHTCFEFTVK
ncbi:MAG: galactose-1-epimerase, partial [Oscillospiraceae bacterium]|nr:galactose-1-epimerase [Oscillospiraceae bacterium]